MTTRLGTQYQKSKPQPNPTMDPNFEAFIKSMNDQIVTQLITQINQSNTQLNHKLDQLIQSSNQAIHSFDQVEDQLGTLGKTHRVEPLPYEPQESIVPRYEPSSNPLSLSQPKPYKISTPSCEPSIGPFFFSQPPLTTPLVHQDDLEDEIYEADESLVNEYEEEEEFPIEDLELVESIDIQVEATLELVDPDHTHIEVDPELDGPDHTQAIMEEQLGENLDPITRTPPEETLEEDPIIEPSPKFLEPDDFIKALAYQYPQEESHPVVPIDESFS